MDVKKWLSRAYKIDQQIKSKQEQIEWWESLATKITCDPAAALNGGSGYANKIESYVIKIADACNALEQQLQELITTKREVEIFIQRIEDITSRVLLEQRYLMGKGWIKIAEFMGYTEPYLKLTLHRLALDNARKYFEPY